MTVPPAARTRATAASASVTVHIGTVTACAAPPATPSPKSAPNLNTKLSQVGFYLIFGSVITGGTDTDMAYAGGLMATTVLSIGGCLPAMILGWIRPNPDA